jgi:hypothetical protein
MRDRLQERLGKPHLSYSSMKYALGDMRLWEMYMRGQLKKQSEALTFGTMYDMLLFDPKKAKETYFVIDDYALSKDIDSKKPKLTKIYKERVAEATEEAVSKGSEIVSGTDWKKATEMIERLEACGLKESHLTGKFQVEFNQDLDGVPLKGFLDCLGDGFITDSKSARSVDKFRYDVNSWSYDIQAFIYTSVFDIKDFYWVVQEKAFPFYPALVKCSDETLFRGEMKYHQALENINKWLDEPQPTEKHYAEFVV